MISMTDSCCLQVLEDIASAVSFNALASGVAHIINGSATTMINTPARVAASNGAVTVSLTDQGFHIEPTYVWVFGGRA
jgi:hypothetical protein